MYTEHTLTITIRVIANGPPEMVRERVQNLLDYGTIRDAFDSARMPLVSAHANYVPQTLGCAQETGT